MSCTPWADSPGTAGMRRTFKRPSSYFEQAIQLDPNYALAYAGLADCHVIQTTYSRESPKRAWTKAHRRSPQGPGVGSVTR